MRFELPATRTQVHCGGDKQSFTVVLAVKADGEKLPPKVIFKGVCQLRIEVPRRMQVSVHKKAWMDKGLLFFLYRFGVFNSGHDSFIERFVVTFASFRENEVRNLFNCF